MVTGGGGLQTGAGTLISAVTTGWPLDLKGAVCKKELEKGGRMAAERVGGGLFHLLQASAEHENPLSGPAAAVTCPGITGAITRAGVNKSFLPGFISSKSCG